MLVVGYQQPHDVCGWLDINRQTRELRYPEIADHLPAVPETCIVIWSSRRPLNNDARISKRPAIGPINNGSLVLLLQPICRNGRC